MTRLSNKSIINRQFGTSKSLQADFVLSEVEATIRDKGYSVVYERVLLCPCKSKDTPAHLSTCDSCGGSGFLFVNPTKTKMIITGIQHDSKLKEAALQGIGLNDFGNIKVTAINADKFTYMDRITILDATAEQNQILYPTLSDDETVFFAFTQYNIISFDFIGLYIDENTKLQRLLEPTDYSFQDNIITLSASLKTYLTNNNITHPSITVRYTHRPVFHIIDVLRESMTSTKGQYQQGQEKLIMPIHAIARRAHLIKDAENFDGDRLLDNSWLPSACEAEDITTFERQLRYTSAQDIFNNLTTQQITDLDALIHS